MRPSDATPRQPSTATLGTTAPPLAPPAPVTVATDVRALAPFLDGLLDLLADRVASRMASQRPIGLAPLADVAARLGWSRRQLKTFCRAHGVPVHGTQKRPLVDGAAVDGALAANTRVGPTAGARGRAIDAGLAAIGGRR